AQLLLLKGIEVGIARRSAHYVHVVAILVGRAVGADRCRVAVHRVRMPETEPVTEFVSRHAQLEIAVNPCSGGVSSDSGHSPEEASVILRKRVVPMRVCSHVEAGGRRSRLGLGGDRAGIAYGRGGCDGEPADDVAGEPGLLEGVLLVEAARGV